MPEWHESDRSHKKHCQHDDRGENQPAPRKANHEFPNRSPCSAYVTASETIPELFDEHVVDDGYHPEPDIVRTWRHLTSLRSISRAASAASGGRRLRVAVVTEYYYPHIGGICENVHHFAAEARTRGHHVDVITGRIAGVPPRPNVITIPNSATVQANGSTCRLTLGLGLRSRVRDVLRAGAYDVVHAHAPLAPSLPMIAIEEAECPVAGTFHAYHEFSVAYALGRRYFQGLMDRIDAKLPVSAAARDAVAKYFSAEWTIVPNGIDTTRFTPTAARARSMPADGPTVLFVGRFDPRNGLSVLIDAFKRARARGISARLVIVGDGPLRDRYRALAYGRDDIVFLGHVSDGLEGYYAHASVYACPATLGSFGITLLEAMACGTPIVCYDTPGFRNVVAHEEQALMTPPGDVSAFADALVRVLQDPDLRARMGRAGQARASAYAWPRVAEQTLAVYHRLVHGRRASV
jgi:phosphatidyl-myo-inositol alpha-mannosyltransferase